MQIDTMYMTTKEFSSLYYDGASELGADAEAVIRQFIATYEGIVNQADEHAKRAVVAQGIPVEPPKFKAKVHIHFLVEPV